MKRNTFHYEKGKEGEGIARAFLVQQGYTILSANWHWHHYELDIVATYGDELVIVEVKTRSENFLVDPEEAIDKGKIRRLVAAADAYARLYNWEGPVRFDIIFLIGSAEHYQLEHLEDAFYPPVRYGK